MVWWYGMVWYGMVWYGTVWYGMVWYGMVRYGMVRYGTVWYVAAPPPVQQTHGSYYLFTYTYLLIPEQYVLWYKVQGTRYKVQGQ